MIRIIFISMLGDTTGTITDEIQRELSELGVETNLCGRTQDSFYVVLDGGKSVDEGINEDSQISSEGDVEEITYTILSAGATCGNTSSIVVNGTEYSRTQSGLNIVVWNKQDNCLVDAVNFDTANDFVCRR